MLDKFKEHIVNDLPFLSKSRVLIAVSGGLDSMVLAHLCLKAEMNMTLAHCNFHLRGEESDGDEQFVVEWADDHNVEVFIEHFDTQAYAETEGLSIQMAARELRYNWFDRLCTDLKFDYVLTAHHADDNLETFIINLSRGTGLEGLSGIPQLNKKRVRPLLPFSRKEIEIYAKENKISWREDSSNQETKYLRNKIRHEIVPKLKELHPQFLQNFLNTQIYLEGNADILNTEIGKIQARIFRQEEKIYRIAVDELKKLQPLKAYLYELFKDFGFTQWDDIADLLNAQSGKQLFSSTHRMLKDRDDILLERIEGKDETKDEYHINSEHEKLTYPLNISLEAVKKMGEQYNNLIYVDKEKLKFPLLVRKWENGDYFYPLGLGGKKKLSKFFKDEKFSLIAKENQWLLCSANGDIIWIIGKRTDQRYRITEKTNQILKIQLH
ncbi:tRNA lysidine(34) synthetase TilS [Leptobacterium flavescens]|uniref:tRNA(Ile)-lysidine synthase n=1 Tax=Leptobacterium flavescens TaxID=472055 RepID=A0A6P0USU9_9FLAO|nr:tRNA lysidine(34) synthetase TilS [Leptobacterium flavescens]NER13933.1 tRNA lysidine(34) synthetase TilS [Leptobacterium flavescens]